MDDPASRPAMQAASADDTVAGPSPNPSAQSPMTTTLVEPAREDQTALLSPTAPLSYSPSGPLPDPHHFAAYDQIHPGAASRILAMAENALQMRVQEQLHIQAMQAGEAAYAREGLRYGAALAFIIVIGLIVIAVFGLTVAADKQTSSFAVVALGGFGALGLVGILVNGRKSAEKPAIHKRIPQDIQRRSKRKQRQPLRQT